MHLTPRSLFSRPGSRRVLGSLIGLGALFAQAALASAVGDGIRELGAPQSLRRSVALKDLGVTDPVVLSGMASQEFYLPVPRGLPLSDASLAFEGRYLKGEAGTTSMVLSLNGSPAAAQAITDGEGTLQRSMAVGQPPRSAEFVRLGVNWSNRSGQHLRCDEYHSLANSLTISPQTRLSYRVDPRDIRSIEDAWNTLPFNPTVLVAGSQLDKASFDTAWRVAASLQRAGKRPSVRALPAVGDMVDVGELAIPGALSGVPAFAALKSGGGTHKIASAAELGALIALGAAQAGADVVVADKAMQQKIAAALDALQAELASDPDAGMALQQLRGQRLPLATESLASQQIRLLPMGRKLVLAVAADAGAQVAGLQETAMQRLLTSQAVTVPVAQPAQWDESRGVRLSGLGSANDSFEVLARGYWSMSFPLNAVASRGQMPSEISLYLAAAPGASSTRPVATIYWNGILLAARQLDATGHPERLHARVPGYALGINNTLRVMVQRQPYSADCNEIPQAYPVSVLSAISYVKPGDAQPDGTFIGLLPLLGGPSQLLVPEAYLSAAPQAAERVAAMAAASGLSASQAELLVAQANAAAKPTRPFLSMDVALPGTRPLVSVADGKRLQIRGKEVDWLDISGIRQLSSAEVVEASGQRGVLWHAIGEWERGTNEPFLLNRGNIAVIGSEGPVAWIDSSNPDASIPPGAGESAFYEWRRYVSWGVPGMAIAMLALLLLLVLAWSVARRKQAKNG